MKRISVRAAPLESILFSNASATNAAAVPLSLTLRARPEVAVRSIRSVAVASGHCFENVKFALREQTPLSLERQ